MSKFLNLIILFGLLSCAIKRANNCCYFKTQPKKIIGVCEVKFSKLYGDSIYLLDHITIHYVGNRVGLGYGSILNTCPHLQKYVKEQSNIEKFHPWLSTKFISNGANIFTKLGSKDVFMVYGLEMQGLTIETNLIETSCKDYLHKQLYKGFGTAEELDKNCWIVPIHYDSIFKVPLKYIEEQKLLKLDSLRPFQYFNPD